MNNAQLVIDEVKKAVKGKDDCIIKAFAAFLAGGHILLEDVAGSGKDYACSSFFKGDGACESQSTVHSGCAAC